MGDSNHGMREVGLCVFLAADALRACTTLCVVLGLRPTAARQLSVVRSETLE